jgi:chemotaxis protein CheX
MSLLAKSNVCSPELWQRAFLIYHIAASDGIYPLARLAVQPKNHPSHGVNQFNVEVINPFVNAVFSTFETMIGKCPTRESPYLKDNARAQGDVTGVIGFAEKNLQGSVALSFPSVTAIKVYNAVMGENVYRLTRDVQDLVGELTNIVAGGAKQVFAEKDLSFHISIPTIVVGKDHSIRHQLNIPVLVVPFMLEGDPFILEVTLKLANRV